METEFQPLVRIIDDDEAFRDSHEMLFRLEGWDVESFADASSFLEKASTKRPGCILLDIRMPGLSGPQLQEELNRRGNRLPIIIMTGHADVQTAVQTLKNGAIDYLEKQESVEKLIQIVRNACDQSVKDALNQAADNSIIQVYRTLTPRELEVLELFARGLQIKDAASTLNLSPTTVKMHRQNAFDKIGAHTSLEAYQWLQEVPESVRRRNS